MIKICKKILKFKQTIRNVGAGLAPPKISNVEHAYKTTKTPKIKMGVFMLLKRINKKMDKIIKTLEKANIVEISYILGNKKEILKRNLIAGIARGIGIGIGITIITAIIIYLLRKLIMLNIPVIGDYIADIVEIVENNR